MFANYTELEQFEVRAPKDEVKPDDELWCWKCETHVCDIEHGDGLDTLARTAIAHVSECKGDTE